MPTVELVTLTDSATVTFTGKGFFTIGYKGAAQFNGIDADEVTISNANTAVAKWNKGVPVVAAATAP